MLLMSASLELFSHFFLVQDSDFGLFFKKVSILIKFQVPSQYFLDAVKFTFLFFN